MASRDREDIRGYGMPRGAQGHLCYVHDDRRSRTLVEVHQAFTASAWRDHNLERLQGEVSGELLPKGSQEVES